MGIDKETNPSWINIVLDDNPEYFESLRAQAEEDGQLEDGDKKISLTMDKHSFDTEEYYFDDADNTIYLSGLLRSETGESFVSICMPLSDTVLIDILQYSIKKLNKLKTAMESLK